MRDKGQVKCMVEVSVYIDYKGSEQPGASSSIGRSLECQGALVADPTSLLTKRTNFNPFLRATIIIT